MLASNYVGYDQTHGMTTEEGFSPSLLLQLHGNYCMLHRGWSTHFDDIYSANQVISKSETYDSILPLFLVKDMSAIFVQSSCNVSHIVGFRCVGW